MLNKLYIITIIVSIIITGFISVSAIEEKPIPAWVKNTAGWWSEGIVSDAEFVDALQFLINENILNTKQDKLENDDKDYYEGLDGDGAFASVVLTTDKNNYKPDESVHIIFENVGNTKIRIQPYQKISIYDNEDNFVGGYASAYSDSFYILPNKPIKFTWDQTKVTHREQDENGLWADVKEDVPPGIYYIRTGYSVFDSTASEENRKPTITKYKIETTFVLEE
jgi:hypothetical protein